MNIEGGDMKKIKLDNEKLISNLGGKNNIVNFTHCLTRLRFELKNIQVINEKKLLGISKAVKVNIIKNECHLIVGPIVEDLYYDINKTLRKNELEDITQNKILKTSFLEKAKDNLNNIFKYKK